MGRARIKRVSLAVLMAGWVGSAGCTANYYYGAAPAYCGPSPSILPGAVRFGSGSVCEVPPTQVSGGTLVADGPTTNMNRRPPRVVESDPINSRLPWRRSNPDTGVASTKVEGSIDDVTLTK